jgi:hypothetical protein
MMKWTKGSVFICCRSNFYIFSDLFALQSQRIRLQNRYADLAKLRNDASTATGKLNIYCIHSQFFKAGNGQQLLTKRLANV